VIDEGYLALYSGCNKGQAFRPAHGGREEGGGAVGAYLSSSVYLGVPPGLFFGPLRFQAWLGE